MYLDKSMRVLTIGDGDLSFSFSLYTHYKIKNLTVSALDSELELRKKYTTHAIDGLKRVGAEIIYGLDITESKTIPDHSLAKFDLIVFQFPLIPNAVDRRVYENTKRWGSNGQNRALLFKFLQHSFEKLLDPDGSRLVYITSKDVKPYCDWDIENLHRPIHQVEYLGWDEFNLSAFPGYQLRNVDRDKKVKSTSAKTYVWTDKPEYHSSLCLNQTVKHKQSYCSLCGKGPFLTTNERNLHEKSKRHLKLQAYDKTWQLILAELGFNINSPTG